MELNNCKNLNTKWNHYCDAGQMTLEIAIVTPVLIVVALIAMNALLFISECARFDRLARQAICVCSIEEDSDQNDFIKQKLEDQFNQPYLSVSVASSSADQGLTRYDAVLEYKPHLFNARFRGQVFGIEVSPFAHTVSYVVDRYKPGIVV